MKRFYVSSCLFLMVFFHITVSGFAVPMIDCSPQEINIVYDTRQISDPFSEKIVNSDGSLATSLKTDEKVSSLNNNNLNIPLNMTVYEDMKAYKLSVIQDFPFSMDQNIQISIHLPALMNPMTDGEFMVSSPLNVSTVEQVFFSNTAPAFQMQQFTFYVDVLIPEDIRSGNYQANMKFILYQDELPVAERSIRVTVDVSGFMAMEVFFMDSNYKGLDFGLVNADLLRQDKFMKIRVMSNMQTPYRLLQRRGKDMKSNLTGVDFNEEGIYYQVDKTGLKGSIVTEQAQQLKAEDELIYESDAEGSSDLLSLVYSVVNLNLLKAGKYKTTLTYFIESTSSSQSIPSLVLTFDLIVEIEKILRFSVYPENNEINLDFSPKGMEEPVTDRLLKIEVISNTGKTYRFYHSLPNGLLNKDGGVVPPEKITFAKCDATGIILSGYDFQTVSPSDHLIYESNITGDSDQFFVRYRVEYDQSQMAGVYRSDLQFILTDD
ncbi:MAG: hypothetical protein JW774_02920 [Candidatus Aureabacteria bacterium]|nr:hypothetical protein [Candidatus Auribacterota bacterium]